MNNPNLPPQGPMVTGLKRPSSGLAIAAFVVALIGFIAGFVPFFGFIGLVGLVLGFVDYRSRNEPSGAAPKSTGLAIAGMVVGGLATVGAIVWTIFIVWLSTAAKHGSCPHLYAFDGEGYKLDADLASGALFKGAEKDDSDRLESLRAVDGRYRVRLQNDLEEIDNIDSLSLLVVDAPKNVEVLPTPRGALVAVHDAVAPQKTAERHDRDVDSRTFTFSRPGGSPSTSQALLIVRGRNTAFAEDAFVKYMATMGQGVRPLLEMGGETSNTEACACFHRYLDEEMDRMGLPLRVTIEASSSSKKTETKIPPIGPATLRSQAMVIALPEGPGPLTLRIDATSRFWEIDRVEVAPYDQEMSEALDRNAHILKPSRVTAAPARLREAAARTNDDLLALLTNSDERRIAIHPGEQLDIEIDALATPPKDGEVRTVIAHLRGYYDLDIGGQRGVDGWQMFRHRFGLTSLPVFARDLK